MTDIRYNLQIEDVAWIRGHYHCKKCGGEMKCFLALPWKVEEGVRRIGICHKDELIMVESERADPKWIQV